MPTRDRNAAFIVALAAMARAVRPSTRDDLGAVAGFEFSELLEHCRGLGCCRLCFPPSLVGEEQVAELEEASSAAPATCISCRECFEFCPGHC